MSTPDALHPSQRTSAAFRWAIFAGAMVMVAIGIVLLFLLTQATNNRELYESNYGRLFAINVVVATFLLLVIVWIVVIALLAVWGFGISALVVSGVLAGQIAAMPKLIRDPAKYAPWYNGVGVTLYVLGMLAAALGLGGYI